MDLVGPLLPKLDSSNPNSFTAPISPISLPNILGGLRTGTLCCIPNADTHLNKLFPALNQTLISMLLLSIAGQDKYKPDTKTRFKEEYDYIIVGAGAAGSALAARLSEDTCRSVLLLEAGGDPPIASNIPGIARLLLLTNVNWNYLTEKQNHTGKWLHNNQMPFPAGKAVGGSSIVNAMLYIRGNHKDYDEWAEDGAVGWSWADVFPYFKKLENNIDPDIANNGYHGINGPVTFSRLNYTPELKEVLLQGVSELGYPYVEPNGPTQIGYSDYQSNIMDGERCSAARAYLAPNDKRPNLDIVAHAFVKKVVIRDNAATGVTFDFHGFEHFVRARKEVILSAGTVNTAKILMLSGVGPKETLEKFNIPVVVDSPVGKNFQDHCCSLMNFVVDAPIPSYTQKITSLRHIFEYIREKTGPLTSNEGAFSMAFQRSNDSATPRDVPNYQLYFLEGAPIAARLTFGLKPWVYEQVFAPYEHRPILWCLSSLLHPKSQGYVSIRSSNPYDDPIIDPNFLEDPQDMKDVVAGMKGCLEMTRSKAMKDFGVTPFKTKMPGCEDVSDEEKYLECLARAFTFTLSHQVGTAKMGDPNDPTTVVDPNLRVKGVEGLRVVDASIMPKVISGNTNIPSMMVGEKAADIIKEASSC